MLRLGSGHRLPGGREALLEGLVEDQRYRDQEQQTQIAEGDRAQPVAGHPSALDDVARP